MQIVHSAASKCSDVGSLSNTKLSVQKMTSRFFSLLAHYSWPHPKQHLLVSLQCGDSSQDILERVDQSLLKPCASGVSLRWTSKTFLESLSTIWKMRCVILCLPHNHYYETWPSDKHSFITTGYIQLPSTTMLCVILLNTKMRKRTVECFWVKL